MDVRECECVCACVIQLTQQMFRREKFNHYNLRTWRSIKIALANAVIIIMNEIGAESQPYS